MIHNFTLTGALVLSAYLGWRHADEPFYDARRTKTSRSLMKRAFMLVLIGMIVVLLALVDPNGSAAVETYHSMSTTGFKIFWLGLMGGLIIGYGAAQLVFHDAMASFHRLVRVCESKNE